MTGWRLDGADRIRRAKFLEIRRQLVATIGQIEQFALPFVVGEVGEPAQMGCHLPPILRNLRHGLLEASALRRTPRHRNGEGRHRINRQSSGDRTE
jgi:hypothetical protein